MKNFKLIVGAVGAMAVAAVVMTACVSEGAKQAKLAAQAKISKADAEKAALAKVPNGTVKEGEIEEENGKLIWSFDITTPGTKDISEVGVDAMTGEVVSVAKETPEDEAKEKAAEGKKEKPDKD